MSLAPSTPAMAVRALTQHRTLLVVLGTGTLCLALYYPAIAWLVETWSDTKEYSHGFLVPFVSAYLCWIKRSQLAQLPVQPQVVAGSTVMGASLLLLMLGRSGGFPLVEAISLLALLPGLVLYLFGWHHLKVVALPLAYLQFMVPWMADFIERIHWPFQLLSADIGIWLLRGFGIPALQVTQFIQLPGVTLEVARECSGVRFLMSVVALGLPLVYLTQPTWWRAGAVIAAGLLISILTNGVRVALAGLMGYRYGSDLLHGPFHIFQGWFVAQVGFLGLLAVNWAACRLLPRRGPRLYERHVLPSDPAAPRESAGRREAALLACLAALTIYLSLFSAPVPVATRQPLGSMPLAIGSWYVTAGDSLDASPYFPGASAELRRTYHSPEKRAVQLYVGYFDSQGRGRSVINFRGDPLWRNAQPAPTPPGAPAPPVHLSRLTINRQRLLVQYWFQLPGGQRITSRYQMKLRQVTDALFRRRNPGAVVLLATPIEGTGEAEEAASLSAFAQAVAPLLSEYLP